MDELISTFHIDWKLMIAQIVNFGLVLFILFRLVAKPLGKLMNDRSKEIADGLENAKLAEKNLSVANMQKEDIIREARVNAGKIVADSQADGKEIVKESKVLAENEKASILQSARAEAEKAKQGGEEEVRREAARLVTLGMKKMVESYVAEGKGEEIIGAMLSKQGPSLLKN